MSSIKTYHRTLLSVMLLILWVGYIQGTFRLFEEKQLEGDVVRAEDITFDLNSWFSGSYQEGKEAYLSDNFGFQNTCIRINNQVNYSLYNRFNAKEIVAGKDDIMFEASYIYGYYGMDAVPSVQILNRLESLKTLSDTLRQLGKTLLVVITPGKASYFNEFIPDQMKTRKDSSNYDKFTALYPQYGGLNLIDFRAWFLKLKSQTPHPLFPKYGVHWAPYGVELAADSIFDLIETVDSIKLRRLKAVNYIMEPAHDVDFDIGAGLNLLFGPGEDVIAYPEHEYIQPENHTMPRLLVIGDSFYYNLFDRFNYSFSENIFWYYFRDTRTLHLNPPPSPSLDEVKNQIGNSDIVILMVNETKIHDMGWGFLEMTDALFRNQGVNP